MLGAPGYRGSYGRYRGSGFQHLERVQTLTGTKWWARWKLEDAKEVGFQLRILEQPDQEVFVTDGRVSPTGKNPWVLKYLIARRRGEGLTSRYVTLMEPYRGTPEVIDVARLETTGDGKDTPYAIGVRRRDGTDVLVYQTQPNPVSVSEHELHTDAALCLARLGEGGAFRALYAMNGTYARVGEQEIKMTPQFRGVIADVDYAARAVHVKGDDSPSLPTDRTLVGRPIIFSNDKHTCLYTIRRVERQHEGYVIALKEPEIMAGKAQVTGVQAERKEVRTGSQFAFPAIYPGMRLVNEAKTVSVPVASVRRGLIALDEPCQADDLTDADQNGVTDVWLCDFGPGDSFRVDSVAVLRKTGGR